MARVSPTWFVLVLLGLLLLSLSASTLARMQFESNVNKEVIAKEKSIEVATKEATSTTENGEMIWKPRGVEEEALKLENGEIMWKPKAAMNEPNDGCVGPTESCGPAYPCCGIMTCVFDWPEFRFSCV